MSARRHRLTIFSRCVKSCRTSSTNSASPVGRRNEDEDEDEVARVCDIFEQLTVARGMLNEEHEPFKSDNTQGSDSYVPNRAGEQNVSEITLSDLQLFESSANPHPRRTERPHSPVCTSNRSLYLRSYLSDCVNSHGECRDMLLDKVLARDLEVMLIDVKNRRLVKSIFRDAPKYIILSYVWGNVPQLQTVSSNLAALQQVGALGFDDIKKQIPQVIQDAMTITQLLEEQYLWVDSLCICQDDPKSKHKQIQSMGYIYSGALATIISLAGNDANTKLIAPKDQAHSPVYRNSGIGMIDAEAFALEQSLLHSVYNTRGWTFQERILSRRCIFFDNRSIFFACRQSFHTDGAYSRGSSQFPPCLSVLNPFLLVRPDPVTRRRWSDWRPSDRRPSDRIFEMYINIVRQYTNKHLSLPEDILAAFEGISAVFKHVYRLEMHLGLPREHFFQALLWTSGSYRRNVTVRSASFSKTFRLPSWSWVGWGGGVDYALLPLYSNSYEAATTPAAHDLRPQITVQLVYWDDNVLRGSCLVGDGIDMQFLAGIPRDVFCLHICANVTPFRKFSCDKFDRVKIEKKGPTGDEGLYHEVAWLAGEDKELCGILYGVTEVSLAESANERRDLIWLGETKSQPMIRRWYYPRKSSKLNSSYGQIPWTHVLVMLIVWRGDVAERLAVGHIHNESLFPGERKSIILA